MGCILRLGCIKGIYQGLYRGLYQGYAIFCSRVKFAPAVIFAPPPPHDIYKLSWGILMLFFQ